MRTLTFAATAAFIVAATATPGFAQAGAATTAHPGRDDDRARIEQVQRTLKDSGHDPGPIDGVIGSQTAAALRAYQREHGLRETGRLDDATWTKLGGRAKPSSNSTQTGGDTKPSAVDPAEGTKTGANVGEGASYSRSTEKGESTRTNKKQ